MESQKGERRIAPFNTEKRSENLDGMIVIPSYDEGEKIIDTIFTAVMQNYKSLKNVHHGVTVVINNRPLTEPRVLKNNFRTYILLQALEHNFPLTLRGSRTFTEKVKAIQGSRVPIHIVDSFSEGFVNEQSNVGRARRIGTEYAITKLHDKGVVISTDADTVLSKTLLMATKIMFDAQENLGGVSLNMYRHLEGTSLLEKRASVASDIAIKLADCIEPSDASLEESFVWMSGGGSAFRGQSYKILFEKGKGYTDVPGEEDTLLGAALSDEGWDVEKVREHDEDMTVSTQQRFSERASTGYGRHTLRFDPAKNTFGDILVESPAYIREKNLFLRKVEDIYYNLVEQYPEDSTEDPRQIYRLYGNSERTSPFLNRILKEVQPEAERRFSALCDEYQIPEEAKQRLCDIYHAWVPNRMMTRAHHDFLKQVKDFFGEKYPKVRLALFVESVQELFAIKSKEMREIPAMDRLSSELGDMPWQFEQLEAMIFNKVLTCGVNLNNEEIRLKVAATIAGRYKNFLRKTMGLLDAYNLDEQREKYRQAGEEENATMLRFLEITNVPDVLRHAMFKAQTMEFVVSTVNEIRNNLLLDEGDSVIDKLKGQILKDQEEYTAYHDTYVKKHAREIIEEAQPIVDMAQEVMDEIEKKAARRK